MDSSRAFPFIFAIALAALSILMVLVLVPLSAELIFGGRGRRAGSGAFFAERWLALFPASWPPLAIWSGAYGLIWLAIIGLCLGMVLKDGGPERGHNLGVLGVVFGGFWGLQAAITWFGRALARGGERPSPGRPPAAPQRRVEAALPRAIARSAAVERAEYVSSADISAPAPAAPESLLVQARRWLITGALVFAAVVLGEAIPGLKSLEGFLKENREAFLWVAGAATAAGLVAFMGGIIHMILHGGSARGHAEIDELLRSLRDASARPYVWRKSVYRHQGAAAGGHAHDEFSFGEMKDALAAGAWRVDPVWRRRMIIAAAGLTALFGLFAIVFILAPAGLKLLVGGAMAYAGVRMAYGFWRS